ncbi:hypothetical protein ACVWXL_006291 [Bradyrhizobium sp. GM22.5]
MPSAFLPIAPEVAASSISSIDMPTIAEGSIASHIRRIAFLQCVLEDAEAEYVKMGSTTLDERLEYQRLSNTQSRLMKKIGLFNASADPVQDEHDDPLAYAERGGVRRPHRERLEDDKG